MRRAGLVLVLLLLGCLRIPEGVRPVEGFELQKYLGTWYEIARLDHSFERGLSHVTASYSLRDDGGVRVVNRGYSAREGSWKEAEGRAYFVRGPGTGFFKVSFFGPFYGAYLIADLDQENYGHSLVCGPNRSYFWILAREPHLEPAVKERLLARAAELGFDTRALIFVDHTGKARP